MEHFLSWVLAAALGGLVGAVEIAQRYHAEPIRAVTNRWGLVYIGINCVFALLAFWVAWSNQRLAVENDGLVLAKWAAAAGLGSSVLLRAKLFDVKLAEGKEAALGPEIIVQTCLGVLDRQLDRERARFRFETVRNLFRGIDYEKAKIGLPQQVFQAMQTATPEDFDRLMKGIAEIDKWEKPDSQGKAYLLGYYLLDLVGDEFLTAILKKYGDDYSLDT